MPVSDVFCQIFDNLSKTCTPYKGNGPWCIHESDKSAKLTDLDVQGFNLSFVGFDQGITKCMPSITSNRSTIFKDLECDGVAFVIRGSKEKLLFVELKSKYDALPIINAIKQMCFSFLKMHAMLALCSGYTLQNLDVCFCVATGCAVNKAEEDKLKFYLSKALQSPNAREFALRLQELFRYRMIEIAFADLLKKEDILPTLHDDIKKKMVKVHLVTAPTPHDTKAMLIL